MRGRYTAFDYQGTNRLVPPVPGAVAVYWIVNTRWVHKGWLMPEPRGVPLWCSEFGHIFDLGDDACCDICGVPRREIVNMGRYRNDWAERLGLDGRN